MLLDGGSNGNSVVFGDGRRLGMWRWIAAPSPSAAALAVTAIAGIAVLALIYTSNKSYIKSPWSRRKRRNALSPEMWRSMFNVDGKLNDDGVRLLKKIRSGGVDQSIRAEVWPFLLGVYELGSTKEERTKLRSSQRLEYEELRRKCQHLIKPDETTSSQKDSDHSSNIAQDDMNEENNPEAETSGSPISCLTDSHESSEVNSETREDDTEKKVTCENFETWQRIIRLDAIRANSEWMPFSTSQAEVSETTAHNFAEAVGLKDYDHLEPSRVFHAARLVAILEAYSVFDPEIGYCQGMSDLLSPILAVIPEDFEAFWCFVGFMKKARHNFRLDEVGIRRQLGIVAKIIKFKDSQLFRHLEKLQAEDCFFVYRMVVVLFRRELSFEQTLCLWEVMWADQTAARTVRSRSEWARIMREAPPTDDLLLYAIAACVLQRRKLIIEKYSSMDEILRECNSMTGHLDVWKLLDDAHDLVLKIHDKIETTLH